MIINISIRSNKCYHIINCNIHVVFCYLQLLKDGMRLKLERENVPGPKNTVTNFQALRPMMKRLLLHDNGVHRGTSSCFC